MAESNVRLRVDARDAVNQLNRVNSAAGKTEKQVKGLSGAVTKLVGAFAGVKAAQFIFFKTAELETQTRSLKVLTGSLEDTKTIIKDLQKFGNVTPFTSTELIETAKRLKAFGVETDRLVDVTKRLGDVAGATGADLGGIATAFGQIQAKGRLQGEELLQLQERGVDLQGVLRKEYDLTAEEFQDALSKGRIGADAANFALEKLTETGGKYADGAISQSDTLNGKFSTLQDNVDQLARIIGERLSPVIKGVFDQAITALNAVNRLLAAGRQGGFNRSIGGISTALTFGASSQALDNARDLIGQVTPQKNKAGIEQNIQVLTQLSNQLQRIGANDPNASRAVGLQGVIMRLQNENLAALKNVPKDELTALTIPELGSGNKPNGKKGGSKTERTDASEKLLQLTRDLINPETKLTELQKISLNFQINREEIMQRSLMPREKEIALLRAQGDFEQELIGFNEEQIRLKEKQRAEAEKQLEQLREAEQKRREADPGFQMQQQLDELIKLETQVAAGATAIGNAFSNSFKSIVDGSKSAEQALADMMGAVAEHFLNMAAQIIAQQIAMILYGTIMKALGLSLPSMGSGKAGVGQMADMGSIGMGGPGIVENKLGQGFGTLGPNFGFRQYAEGGFVTGPTNAVVGEGGEPEYIIPQSKMRESMERYSRGTRGSAVIPAAGNSGASGAGGGVAVAAPIDVRFNVERINNVDYVTAAEFQEGMQQAAKQGAQRGEQQAIKRLQMSSSTRRRVGL